MFYIVSDIHGHIRLPWLKEELSKIDLANNDYLIITGDAGICWDSIQNKNVMDFYNSLPCKTLFVDGNHENFDVLLKYPVVEFCKGKAHKISEKIYHLIRGEIFMLSNKKVFCFGGGFSAKILTNSSPIYVWNEELPNLEEYKNGLDNLKKCNFNIDLILTHSAPLSVVKGNLFSNYPNDNELLNYLELIKNKTKYSHWYYGHYHKDVDNDKFSCIYNRVIKMEA